jgi:hypothetical protein
MSSLRPRMSQYLGNSKTPINGRYSPSDVPTFPWGESLRQSSSRWVVWKYSISPGSSGHYIVTAVFLFCTSSPDSCGVLANSTRTYPPSSPLNHSPPPGHPHDGSNTYTLDDTHDGSNTYTLDDAHDGSNHYTLHGANNDKRDGSNSDTPVPRLGRPTFTPSLISDQPRNRRPAQSPLPGSHQRCQHR